MVRDKFMFFPNFKAMADKLDDKMRLEFYDSLTNYVFCGQEPEDPIISALLEAIKPSLDKVDGRQNNGGNHNPNGVNQHSKVGQSGQIRSKLVNSGQILSETETETEVETETKEKEISNDISKKKPIDFDTTFQAGGQLWVLPPNFRKLALTRYTESEIRAFEKTHSCHESLEDVCLNDIKHEEPKPKKKDFVPPTIEEWRAFCKELKLDLKRLESIYYGYSENNWRDSHGNQIKNWKMKIRQVWDKPENKDPDADIVGEVKIIELEG